MVLGTLSIFLLYWAFVLFFKSKPRFSPLAYGYAFAAWWGVNLVVFLLYTLVGVIAPLSLPIAGIAGVLVYRRCLSRKVWLGMTLLLVLQGVLAFVPIADTDSVSYVLPMADNGSLFRTLGLWETLNLRSLARFWGNAAIIANQLTLDGQDVRYAEMTSLISWWTLIAMCSYFLRLFKVVDRYVRYSALICIGVAPIFLTSICTAKDDVAFAIFWLLLVAIYLRKRKLSLMELPVHIGLITSKLFFPIAYLSLLCLVARRRRLGAFIAFLTTAYVCVLGYNCQRVYSFIEMGDKTNLRTYIAAGIGASPVEMGVDVKASTTISTAVKYSFRNTEATQMEQNTHISPNSYIQYLATFYHRAWVTIKSLKNPNWFVISDLFYYNYSNLWLLLPYFTIGVLSILLAFQDNAPRYVAAVWLTAVMGILLFRLAISVPSPNNIRYMFAPILLLVILGVKYVADYRKFTIGLLYLSLVTLTAFAFHPAWRQGLAYEQRNKMEAYPLNVATFNPVLLMSNQNKTSIPLFSAKPILFIAPPPAFSAQFLITDRAHTNVIEALPVISSIEEKLKFDPEWVVISGAWNVNRVYAPVDAFKDCLEAKGYKHSGYLLNGQMSVYAK